MRSQSCQHLIALEAEFVFDGDNNKERPSAGLKTPSGLKGEKP
jgi:hypothetical protein